MLALALSLVFGQFSYCPAGNVSNPATCAAHGDPVDLNYGSFTLTRADASIASTQGPLTFVRSFSSSIETWKRTIPGGEGIRNVPKPWGESLAGDTAYWWHNWFSFVESGSQLAYWRQPGGRGTEWSTAGCAFASWSTINSGNDETLMLSCPGRQGYMGIDDEGRRLHYLERYRPNSATTTKWFLTRVDDRGGSPLVSVSYDQPMSSAGALLTNCARPDTATWAPYIRLIQNVQTRATLRLTYKQVTVAGETRCVIDQLQNGFGTIGADPPLTAVKRYTVQGSGGTAMPNWALDARLVRVEQQPSSGFVEEESYFYGASPTSRLIRDREGALVGCGSRDARPPKTHSA